MEKTGLAEQAEVEPEGKLGWKEQRSLDRCPLVAAVCRDTEGELWRCGGEPWVDLRDGSALKTVSGSTSGN